jgi:Ca2+-dependent lipid-binding protein
VVAAVPKEGTATSLSLGRIHFHLSYNFQDMTLNLRLICAEDLPAKDFSGTSDPYVKIVLLPDRKHRLVSNIKRRSLSPRWNELFRFEGYPFSKLSNMTLYMQVLDYDRFSRDDPIGEVCLPLNTVDLANGEMIWQELQSCSGHAGKLGELLLSLHYQPTPGLLTVHVISARGLLAKDLNGLSDPYVKIWMLYDGKRVEKQKTQMIPKTLDPTFNESFVFMLPSERVHLTSLVVSVMDRDHIGQNELIGRIIFGARSTGMMEQKHWNDVFTKPRSTIEQWHVLRDSE